ncbi:penicillin-binding protein [Nonomuraea terrae]|uniref:Penicillin-binding protein n=1 Tax=Nonomuraea terrae TaxID=2530383 RepID=A0A4V2YIQ8_9ACTN|nr:penicillin-binding protein [Nonomuraea terrae]
MNEGTAHQPRPGRRRRSSSSRSVPPSSPPQTGESGWGEAPPQRRPEAAYEQTGAMAAQPYEEPPRRPAQPAPRRDVTQEGPRTRARQEARAMSDQETIVSDGPRRSRRRGEGGPPQPPGPPVKKGGGGRGGWRRFVPSWKIVVAGVVILAAGLFGMVMVAYANTPVPDAKQAEALAQQSTIYYRDGKTVIAHLGFKREIVPISKMAQSVRDGAVAIENQSFYEDSGISIPAMFRSVWMTATGQQVQGASTITQQMARGYYDGLSQEVSIQRKVKEIFVAVKLDESMTKDQIMETYLNTINFGRAYGVEAAAKAYFGKKVTAAKLTPEQGAYLAARIQQPAWDADEPALQARFKIVINNMAEQWPDRYGDLPQTAKFPKTVKSGDANELGGLRGYMVKEVLNELEQRGLDEDEVKSGGYDIISTFDKKLMQAAKTAVTSTTKGMSNEFHAGLAAVDPKNGRVLAFYGGDDYLSDPWNEPFQSQKQAASAFKPYVLAAWLQAGYSLKSFVPGNETVPKELPGQQEGGITNSHNVGAAVDVVKATAQSVNTAFVSMAYALPNQLDDVKNLVEAAGFNQKRMEDDIAEHHYQFAIGSALVTPVEQAAGYAMFANGGKYTRYHVVREVRQNSQVAYPEVANAKQVIDAGVAADATTAMAEVLTTGTAAGKGLGSRPAAGKTGTNNDEKEAWFVGYTPQISTAVGFYREQCVTKSGKVVPPEHSNCPVFRKGSKKYGWDNPYTSPKETSLGFEGAGPPTIVWQKFMQLAHEGLPVEQFPEPAEVGLPENIVPSPTPKPTKSPEDDPFGEGDPFGEDNPFGDGTDEECFVNCDDDVTTEDDSTVDDGQVEEFSDSPDEVGLAGGGSAPKARPSGQEPMSTRPEDQ